MNGPLSIEFDDWDAMRVANGVGMRAGAKVQHRIPASAKCGAVTGWMLAAIAWDRGRRDVALLVRQAWRRNHGSDRAYNPFHLRTHIDADVVAYRAAHGLDPIDWMVKPFEPASTMPLEACAFRLDIHWVRREWLNDMSHADALAEGVKALNAGSPSDYRMGYKSDCFISNVSALNAFAMRWDALHPGEPFAGNPEVLAFGFQARAVSPWRDGVARAAAFNDGLPLVLPNRLQRSAAK